MARWTWADTVFAAQLVTAAKDEPLTKEEARLQSRIDEDEDDAQVVRMIAAARAHVESATRRKLMTQTWKIFLDCFPSRQWPIILPFAPLQSVTFIQYLDEDGVTQLLDTSVYTVDTDSQPGRIYLAYDQVWPTTRVVRKAVEIQFVAGYGDSPSDVPQDLRHAIAMLMANMNENRETSISGTIITEVPNGYRDLISPFRIELF